MGRVSKKQALENRSKVVNVASRLMKARGVRNVGIDEIMAEAGLTRGGFYKMFTSKEQLIAEACDTSFDNAACTWTSLKEADQLSVSALARYYLSPERAESDCPMVTLGADFGRLEPHDPNRDIFTEGVKRLAGVIDSERTTDPEKLSAIATLVGARMLLASINDRALSEALRSAVLKGLGAAA